jgi:2-keto-4-pentenoate hydratase/2-oxohepta-3-ene-1,7-dioic acid hydratase in catechol pathway
MTRWARIQHEGQPWLAAVEGDTLHLHTGLPWAAPQATGQTLPLADLPAGAWLPPCQPGKIVALWNNFRAAAERNGWAVPAEPLYFLKAPDCAAAHEQPIPAAPAETGRVAYEGELAFVVGRPAWRITREEAAGCILGYTCANDVTALELLNRDASFVQWTRAKSLPGFGAFGPWIDTAFNPAGAQLRTLVGGRERQAYALDDMFFAPQEILWRIAQEMPLAPGDLVLCGTSLGVLPMKPGSTVEVVVDGLGTLRNVYG